MRNIKLKGAKNIRDLSEVSNDKIKIKRCKLLRGTSLESLTDNDVNILVNDYHLSTVIDLRTYREEEYHFDVEIDSVNNVHMPIFEKRAPGITHEKKNDSLDKKVSLSDMYRGILHGKYLDRVADIIKYIVNMEDKDYAVLFHCTEGKDRTGILAAILLMILGVDRELIVEDYLFTNKVNDRKAKRYYLETLLTKRNKEKAIGVKDIYLAKEEYINAIFDVIDNEYGGVDNFIRDGLKISLEEINKFKKNVLE